MSGDQADVECRRCGDPYRRHEEAGGACRVKDRDGRCTCLGFRWVDVEPDPVVDPGYPRGAYSRPPVSRMDA